MRKRWRWLVLLGLALIVLAGAGLRLGYFLNGDPFVDEWATMVAARSIWEHGLPILPSGVFYGHGMLFSYLDALFLAVFGWTAVVAQTPSLIAGLFSIPLAYVVGRSLFAPPPTGQAADGQGSPGQTLDHWRAEVVGLLGAALLALDPVAVLWSGRARAYTLQQVLVMLAILFIYRRKYLGFTLAFAGAVLAHTEAALLLPGFALGLWLSEGNAVLRKAQAWLAMGISGAVVIGQFLIHRFIASGNAGQFQPVDARPALEPSLDLLAGLKPLLPYFTEPYRLVLTVLVVVGIGLALRAWRRQERDSGYLLLYPLLLVTLLVLLTLIGQSWKDPRYLFMLLPAFFLLAAATGTDLLIALTSWAGTPSWLKAAATAGLLALLLIPPLPETLDTAQKLEEGYGPTLAYVRDHWQEGDQVAGWAVPAISVELGRIDYFAMQIRHEEFIMQQDGAWVDRWVGAPLMDSTDQLQAVLDEPGRLWFLTDEFRFRVRYTPEFAQMVWDRMDPVFRYHYALAFLERPAGEPAYHRDVRASFERGLELVGYDLEPDTLQPGDTLALTLHWTARDWVGAPYSVFVHLLDPSGQRVAQDDGPPLDGLHPTNHWLPGERLRDERRLSLPASAGPGRYRLIVGWTDPVSQDRVPLVGGEESLWLATVPLGDLQVDEPGVRTDAELDGQVRLVGYDLWRSAGGEWVPVGPTESVRAGEKLRVRLVWEALAEMEADYTVFVHLEDPAGDVLGQHDGPPAGGGYPTSHWRKGERVADEHELVVGDGGSTTAQLLVGMYRLETLDRLGAALTLRQVEVVP